MLHLGTMRDIIASVMVDWLQSKNCCASFLPHVVKSFPFALATAF